MKLGVGGPIIAPRLVGLPYAGAWVQKFNPFKPNSPVNPGMFSGRIDEILRIEKGLFQTKNGNPYHFLIEGERGIGKSSLLYYLSALANGRIHPDGLNFKMVVVSVELRESMDFNGIVDEILLELKKQISHREKLKEICKSAWDFLNKFEVCGVAYHAGERAQIDRRLDDLTDTLASLVDKAGDEIDGILILADEADKPLPSANLGELCKLLTERLARKGCERVSIGLAGLPGLTANLRESHASAPRVFQILPLGPLEGPEREDVIDKALDKAEEKNGFRTKITEEAKTAIATLSEGYPHFLQEFGYYAFEQDADSHIDRQDVYDGAFLENGALDQLGQKYFTELYVDQVGSEDYRKVLIALAESLDDWVGRPEIIKRSGVKDRIVDNALRALKAKKIITANDRVKGEYRLPTKSFAVWIRARESARSQQSGESLPF